MQNEQNLVELPNAIADGTHETGCITKKCDAALTSENLIVKQGTDSDHVAVTAANTDTPLGIALSKTDAAEDTVGVALPGKAGTKLAVASAAIAVGARVVPTAAGKIVTLPTAGGTYWVIGRALTAATADGDIIEIDDCSAHPVVVT